MQLIIRIGAGVGACAMMAAAAWAGDNITPLDVKPGQWETTMTSTRSGMPPIPPEVLARLPAEQRAKMEERMKSSASGAPSTHVSKSCITKEELEKSFAAFDNNSNCKRTVSSSTSRSSDFKIECSNQGMTSNGTGHVEALDSEHITGKTKMTISGGGQTMVIDSTFSSKWLGATCPDTKK